MQIDAPLTNHTLVDLNSLKNLEDYAVLLASGFLSIETLHNFQVRAIEIGIMPEDMNERANAMIWDLRRLMKHYENQLGAALELIGGDFDHEAIINKMKERELKAARIMTRKSKVKE